ncbi:MAG: four helix bundle protein [Kiritimatiellaceae bacterium]|nr:four helix bundle protein [Kiritimatiellaceae bacterium]
MSKEEKFDLEERLIDFAARCIKVANSLPNTQAGLHLSGQLTRSGTSPALNYGEAQGAESRKDFVHKMRICLKELRETRICLRIIIRSEMFSEEKLQALIDETNELISIFVTSIKTAKANMNRTS